MNKTTFILGILALLFAATTFFFWSENSVSEQKASTNASAIQDASRKVDSTEKAMIAVRNDLDLSRKEAAALKAEIEKTKTDTNATLAQQTSRLTQLQTELDKTKADLTAASFDKGKAESGTIELEKKLSDTRLQVEALNTELARLRDESEVAARDAKIQTLEARIQTLETDLAQARSGNNPEAITLKDDLKKSRNETAIERIKVGELETKVKELEEENEKLKRINSRRSSTNIGSPDYRGV